MSETPQIPDVDSEVEFSETSRTAPFVVAVIHKSAVEHLPIVVHPHELLMLAAVHGQNKVQIDENADLPTGVTQATFEPEDEFARLEQRYGTVPESTQTFAQMVFGSVDGFVDRLDAIEAGGAPSARPTRAKAAKTAAAKTSRSKA